MVILRQMHHAMMIDAPRVLGALSLMAALLLPCIVQQAHAEEYAIAAVVNDTVISTLDLQQRVALTLMMSGAPASEDVINQARPQLLSALINETLQLQEAARFSISISDAEIDSGIQVLEEKNKKPAGSLKAFLQAQGVSEKALREQIRAQLAWRKLLAKVVRRDVIISEEEVALTQKRLARGRQIPEVQIASIIVPYSKEKAPEEQMGIARDIRSQLLNGAEPAELIRAYQNRIGLEFGPVTWIAREELNPLIRNALDKIKQGEIAEPVQTPLGYQIIRLLGSRTISTMPTENAEVALKQIILKLDEASLDAEIASKMAIASEIAKYPGSCTEEGIAGLSQFEGLSIVVNYIRTTIAAMTPDIRKMVQPLPVTGITAPFASEDGIHLLMLCERITIPAPLPDKEQVRQLVFDEKLQLESEKYLRRLRRDAFIDVRL